MLEARRRFELGYELGPFLPVSWHIQVDTGLVAIILNGPCRVNLNRDDIASDDAPPLRLWAGIEAAFRSVQILPPCRTEDAASKILLKVVGQALHVLLKPDTVDIFV